MNATSTPSRYATAILAMIDEDMKSGLIPDTVQSFGELHDHVDANDYTLQADVPHDLHADGGMDELAAVEDEVGRLLAERYQEMLKAEPQTLGAVVMGYDFDGGDLYSFTRTATGGARDWQVAGDVGDADYATVLKFTVQNRQTFIPKER